MNNISDGITVPLGTGPNDELILLDLEQIHHVLVAGAIFSGKTEFIKYLVAYLGLVYPSNRLQLLLVDVTKFEMGSFSNLPNLARPMIRDVNASIEALTSVCTELDERYRKLKSIGVSNIQSYNLIQSLNLMPYLVIVDYEIADIMLGHCDLAADLYCEIAHRGQGVGIHLIAATQRPASDVITETLRFALPGRIAFYVCNREDSKLILGIEGAEKLSAEGAMIYSPTRSCRPLNMRACMITSREEDAIEDLLSSETAIPSESLLPEFIRRFCD